MTKGPVRFSLPEGWVEAPILDFVTHRSGNSKLIKGTLSAAPGPDLFPAYSASGQDVWCDEAEYEGDGVIVSAVGARCGKAFKATGQWSAIANTHVVLPDVRAVSVAFLWYLINNENYWIKSGTAQPFVKVHHSLGRPSALPPLPEQHRIVSALESYLTRLDDAVATLERVQRNLKRYRASVLKAAVEGRLVPTEAELARAEGRDYEPASVLLERILAERRRRWEEAELAKMTAKGKAPKDDRWKAKYVEPVAPDTSELPGLPDGWCWASVDAMHWDGGYGTSSRCETHASGPPVLRIPNVQNESLSFDDLKYASGTDDLPMDGVLLPGDFIFIRTNGSKSLIGRGALVNQPLAGKYYFASYLIRLRLAAEMTTAKWFALSWHVSPVRDQILRDAASSAGQHNVSLSAIRNYLMPLPPIGEQERILNEVGRQLSIDESARGVVTSSVSRLARLRQSILKWAFEGRLVDQDTTDEPASVLLERIRAERQAAEGEGPRKRGRRAGHLRANSLGPVE